MSIVTPAEVYGLVALFLACGIAVWRGGDQERRIAAIVAVAWIGSVVVDDDGSRRVQWAILTVDLVLAVWLLLETVFGRKLWPAFAAAALIMIVMTHVAFAIDPRIVQEGFFSAYYVWSYLVLVCLVVGSLMNRTVRTERRSGSPPWRRPR